jgi:hypothetical protein
MVASITGVQSPLNFLLKHKQENAIKTIIITKTATFKSCKYNNYNSEE